MSFGAKGSKENQQSTSTSAYDPTVLAAQLAGVTQAQNAAGSLLPFTGQRVAGFNDVQTQAQQGLLHVANSNVGGGLLNTAGQAATDAATYKPLQVAPTGYQAAQVAAPTSTPVTQATAAQVAPVTNANVASVNRGDIRDVNSSAVDPAAISAYLNPYTQNVVDTTNADLDRQRQIEQVNNSALATKAHAFGGTGAAVLSGLTNDNYARQTASTDANLRNQGFTTALSAAQADAARKLQADTSNQGVDLSVAGQNAGLLGQVNLANAGAANQQSQFNAALLNTTGLANADATNRAALTDSGLFSQAALANQAATNQAGQFNANQDLTAQQGNQAAGLTANSQSLTAAGLLGQLSDEQRTHAVGDVGLLGQVGDAQQAQQQKDLDGALAAYQAGQQLTLQQQQIINDALKLLPNAPLTQTQSTGKSSSFGFDIGLTPPKPGG